MFKLFSLLASSLVTSLVAAQGIAPGHYHIQSVSTQKYASAQVTSDLPVVLVDNATSQTDWTVVAAGHTIIWRIQNDNTSAWTWRNSHDLEGRIYAGFQPSDWEITVVRETPDGPEYSIRDSDSKTYWQAQDDDTVITVSLDDENDGDVDTWKFVAV